ncbi:hypothetical protein AB0O00_24770, partial [Kitasatospora sp. NPDC093558]
HRHCIANRRMPRRSAAGGGDVFVLHPDDVQGTRRHPDSARRNGCCGPDGQDGPNLVCAGCGAEVATKEADCWTQNLVALMASAVRVAPGADGVGG